MKIAPMDSDYADIVVKLLGSDEPSLVYKAMIGIEGRSVRSKTVIDLQEKIKRSGRVRKLLSARDRSGRIPFHPYRKWFGAHWVLAQLSDMGYPAGDKSLLPLREQVYEWLFSAKHNSSIKYIAGKARRCASQEGYVLYYLLKLGLEDDRTDMLARRLVGWQWPDGGWNCDKKPDARISSFIESLIPMRALFYHGLRRRNRRSREAAMKASELFLTRRLFRTIHDGAVMKDKFIKLHYPCYYEYDILFALKVMADTGLIDDNRCGDALDLLESKRLPDGGFPAESSLYRRAFDNRISRGSPVDWGGVSKRKSNEWVTADALYVLRAAGRLK